MAAPAIAARSGNRIEFDGCELVAFAGCDYLGLSQDPSVLRATRAALARFGLSSGAALETSGATTEHRALERELVRFLGLPAVALLPEGACANLAAAQVFARRGARALLDERCHPTLRGALVGAGLVCEDYAHADASAALRRARQRTRAGQALVIASDGVFPSTRCVAPLAELAAGLPPGAWLLVDDCHGTGVLGPGGRGSLALAGLRASRAARCVLSSTFSKALGGHGAFVAASRAFVAELRLHSSIYLGTTPVPPALAAAGRAALKRCASMDAARRRLVRHTSRLAQALASLGVALPLGMQAEFVPVLAFSLGNPRADAALARALRARGLYVPEVRYPGGPAPSYLRLTLNAAHTARDLARLEQALGELLGSRG